MTETPFFPVWKAGRHLRSGLSRNEQYVSSVPWLYPCGEGAGYAGGITSAAMDGMRVAEAVLIRKFTEN